MLCPISALNPCGGPERLIDVEDLEPVSTEIASEIISYGRVSLSFDELKTIASNALRLTLPPADAPEIYDLAPKLPEGISDWIHYAPIGIGHFEGEDGDCPSDKHGRYPSGHDVAIRRLADYDGYGYFYAVIEEDGEVPKRSCCRPGTDYSFFVLHGPLEYLRAWLDPALPPPVAFMDSAPLLTLEGEMFEILNSQHGKKKEASGLLRGIEYGDIAKTLEMDQFRFLNARKGSRHLSQAIEAGLREAELLPALFSDFQCWQSMRPDIWPVPITDTSTSTAMPVFTAYSATSLADGNPFKVLPTEMLFEILRQLPINSILTLSSTSRSMRGQFTEPAFMNQVIKTCVLSGSEHWVLPVGSLTGEKERAWDAASKWLHVDTVTPLTDSPFLSSHFPYLPFLQACYASDSMRNRQRLWKVVKQYDELWRHHRLIGWQAVEILLDDD